MRDNFSLYQPAPKNQSPTGRLLAWYRQAKRELPWRKTRDPYPVLVSEVMLQQTRVAAVIPYYERFLKRFPDFNSLAAAPESEVLALWSGLGYYNRARNLQKAAQFVLAAGGEFPGTYEGIRQLPGIGDYTAAAIASICFGLPHAVLDGNVIRVLARVTAEKRDVRATAVRDHLRGEAQTLLDPRSPGEFNQAIMELGATVCLPRNPQCLLCPWSDLCRARAEGIANELPVKLGRSEPASISVTLLWVMKEDRILVWQRPADAGRMAGFWELPEVSQLPDARLGAILGEFRHAITHHRYNVTVQLAMASRHLPPMFQWVPIKRLSEMPVSTKLRKSLQIVRKKSILQSGAHG